MLNKHRLLLPLIAVSVQTAFPATNMLIGSGNLAEIESTPIYLNNGISYTVGGVGNTVFDVTARLRDTLAKLDIGQTPAVKNTWSTSEEYEVWTDRLILRKTTNFYVLDGAVFAQTFNGSTPNIDTSHSSVTSYPINLQDLEVLAQNYINSGEHLNLYAEARDAGNLGVQELISELKKDRGPVTIIETVEFSRLVRTLSDPINAHTIDVLANEAVPGKELNASGLASIKDSRSDTFETGTAFSDDSGGIISYNQKMLNGFTFGNEWSKGVTYDRWWYYAHTSVFAGFGLGLRIPWTADVEVSKRVIPSDDPDKTNYEASIEVETLDADTDFYRSVGVPPVHRYRGKEMPLEAGAGIALQIKVLGVWAINKGRYDPVLGKVIDMGQDFDPPLGPTPMNIITLELPYEQSGFAYNAEYAAVGGDFKADIGVRGDSIDLRVRPYNSWNRSGSVFSKNYRNISLVNEDAPISLSFSIDDSSASEEQLFYNFGPIYDQASYNTSLTITPSARIRGDIYLSMLWDELSDIIVTSNWHPLFTAAFSLPSLGPHAGVDSRLEATHRSKRLLPSTPRAIPHRFSSNSFSGAWDFTISDLGSEPITLIEYIPEEFSIESGSITEGGSYDSNSRAITWNLTNKESIPDSVSYRCLAGNVPTSTVPNPVGSFETSFIADGMVQNLNAAIVDLRHDSIKEAELDLDNYILSQRPTLEEYEIVVSERDAKLTLEEVTDLRPGSMSIVVQDGEATLSLEVEESNDLGVWTTGGSSALQVPIQAGQGKKYFRFKMAD